MKWKYDWTLKDKYNLEDEKGREAYSRLREQCEWKPQEDEHVQCNEVSIGSGK